MSSTTQPPPAGQPLPVGPPLPVGQPLYGASFGQAVQRFFRGYVTFSGRASRSEYWWAYLFVALVSLVAQIPFWIAWFGFMREAMALEASSPVIEPDPDAVLAAMGPMLGWLGVMLVITLAIFLPYLAVQWRRLQDANFHGAFALLNIISLGIVPLVMSFFPSHPAGVRFDPAFSQQAAFAGPEPAFGQPVYEPAPGQLPYGQAPGAEAPNAAYGDPAYGGPAYSSAAYSGPTYGGPAYGADPAAPQPGAPLPGHPHGTEPGDAPGGQPGTQR
ncbi:DUF805 domain-containing protein [Agrococcus carbonis]|uniref:Uncharacterized membrane protein YhaH, DUF805 family n=1 Tax=Agrococcus carbonis TaxID=684552 RepID=A0A1H1NW31_9MICO|nr:DUF805 domain-containing protein [Agrococcus carbonis]SDS03153.1 Uncharacterized membrane protein YhaH, DUF805 family [Agrococcus carbonis]